MSVSIQIEQIRLGEVAERLLKSLNSVRDITVQLKWLTINARISAIHLGPPGEPLNVVAGSMQNLQQECETRCYTTGNRIAAMQMALSSGTKQPAEMQTGADMKVNVRAQIGELHSSGERSNAHWRRIEACAASLRENIQSARTRLAVGQRVSDALNRCIERIQPLAGDAAGLQQKLRIIRGSSRLLIATPCKPSVRFTNGSPENFSRIFRPRTRFPFQIKTQNSGRTSNCSSTTVL